MKDLQDFDKCFERMRKFAVVWFIFCALLGLGLGSFVIWVIVKLMQYNGVI